MAKSKPKTSVPQVKPQSMSELFGEGGATPEKDLELKADAPKDKAAPTVEELQAQLRDMDKRFTELQRSNAAMSMDMTPKSLPELKPPTLDLSNLPDPSLETEAYNKRFAKVMEKYNTDLLSYHREIDKRDAEKRSDIDRKADLLWSDFKSEYPDYAANEDRAEFAIQKVATRLRNSGVDVQRYMFSNRSQFMREVASTMDTVFGAPQGGDEEVAEVGEDTLVQRTAGIPVHGAPMPKVKPTNKQLQGDMITELQEVQRKTGFF